MINQDPITLKLTEAEALILIIYLENNEHYFNGYNAIDIIRKWHYNEFYNKLMKAYEKANKHTKAKIKINEIEKHTLSIVFNNGIMNDSYMLVIMEKIIKGLIKIKADAA